jgi:hypothetical protein
VGPLSYNNQELYLKVDPELNRIVVSCGRELSVPAEIGGYKLSAAEKNDLANGRQLKNKVLKGEYGFFLAKVSITDDKKGLVFSEVKELSPMEANRLLAELNRDERVFEKGSVVDNAAIITRDSQSLEQRETLVKKQQESQHNLDREFTLAYEKKNYKELVNLHAAGYVPGEKQIESLNASVVLSHEEKVSVASIFDRAESVIKHKSAKIDNVISSGGIVASKDVSPARGESAAKTASSGVDPVYAKSKNVKMKSKEEQAAEKAGDQNKKQILKEGLGTALTP